MSVSTADVGSPARSATGFKSIAAFAVPIGLVQLAVLYAVLAVRPIVGRPDPDFWWHLRVGDDILRHGIPREDTYSWTMRGEPFVAHEWLSEALIAAVQRGFGYWGNVVIFDLIAIGALAVMAALAMRLGVGSRTITLLSVVAVAAMLAFVTVRPQAFTWLFFSIYVYALTVEPDSRRTRIGLPLMMILWANLHLGFTYGLVVLGALLAARVIDRLRGRGADVLGAAALLALCTVATFANPHGPAILTYPFTYLDDREALSMISEWQSPLTINLTLIPYLLSVLALIAAAWPTLRRSTFHGLLLLGFLGISFGAARNIPFVALLLVPLAGAALQRAPAETNEAAPKRRRRTTMPLRLAAPLFAGVLVALFAVAVRVADASLSTIGGPNDADYPHGGAAYAQEHLRDAHIYNHYTWGGYLLWAAPDVPVFIDGRSDFYGGPFIEDWATIGKLEPGWEELMAEYGIDAAFINTGSRLARELRADPRWEEVFTGRTESIFVLR
jgi:hypothetical protein